MHLAKLPHVLRPPQLVGWIVVGSFFVKRMQKVCLFAEMSCSSDFDKSAEQIHLLILTSVNYLV